MEEFLDLTPGSVTVMGLMNDHDNKVKLVIDRELLNENTLHVTHALILHQSECSHPMS